MSSYNFKMLNVFLVLFAFITITHAVDEGNTQRIDAGAAKSSDLEASSTSAKLFNLGTLFGRNPPYGNGYSSGGYYPSGYQPSTYYPISSAAGYYPSTGTAWTTGSSGVYPSSGGGYYSTVGGYNPDFTTGLGTNILGGNGGYGGYGGNGGLRQYSGYWHRDYFGHRNRGYGYHPDTDRYGLPQRGVTTTGDGYTGVGYTGGGYTDGGYKGVTNAISGGGYSGRAGYGGYDDNGGAVNRGYNIYTGSYSGNTRTGGGYAGGYDGPDRDRLSGVYRGSD